MAWTNCFGGSGLVRKTSSGQSVSSLHSERVSASFATRKISRGREAVRGQDRFRAAFGAAAVQQFKRPDAVVLDGASAMARRRHRGGRITGCTRDTVGLAIARENQAQLARRDTIGTPATVSID